VNHLIWAFNMCILLRKTLYKHCSMSWTTQGDNYYLARNVDSSALATGRLISIVFHVVPLRRHSDNTHKALTSSKNGRRPRIVDERWYVAECECAFDQQWVIVLPLGNFHPIYDVINWRVYCTVRSRSALDVGLGISVICDSANYIDDIVRR